MGALPHESSGLGEVAEALSSFAVSRSHIASALDSSMWSISTESTTAVASVARNLLAEGED